MISRDEEKRKRRELGIDINILGGRRHRWSEKDSGDAIKLLEQGYTLRDISDIMRCSTKTVHEVLTGEK